MTTIREQFTPEGFTDQEAEAIFLRAAELQHQAEQLHTRLPWVMLEDSAAAVRIPREFVKQAIQQLPPEALARRITCETYAQDVVADFDSDGNMAPRQFRV